MNEYSRNLGLQGLEFYDVYSIDEPSLLEFIPRPVYALLLVFPSNEAHHAHTKLEDSDQTLYGSFNPDNLTPGSVVWYKQTIPNACGTMGLLHAFSNIDSQFIQTDSLLDKIISAAKSSKTVKDRINLLESSTELRNSHQSSAIEGQSNAPNAKDKVGLHYLCMVAAKDSVDGKRKLYDLDGDRAGPIVRAELDDNEDLLSDKALENVRRFVGREKESGNLEFALVALAPQM